MSKKQTTVLMAAMLAVATVLAAGLTVLPSSVQEAQANPCSNNSEEEDGGRGGDITTNDDAQNCDLTGYFEFDEESEGGDNGANEAGATENGATETDIMEEPLFDLSGIDVIDEVGEVN
jgi:hypothetical protein